VEGLESFWKGWVFDEMVFVALSYSVFLPKR
jgi:hypothetical protein